MNTWAARHAEVLQRELLPGETLLAAHRVLLTGAEDGSVEAEVEQDADGPLRFGRQTRRLRVGLKHRVEHARRLGFGLPAGIFVLGLSDQRVLFWDATPVLARPTHVAASIPLKEIAAIPIARRFGRIRLAVLREDRTMLVVQPLWSRRLRDIADAFCAVTEPS